MAATLPPPEAAHTKFLRRQAKLAAQHAAGEGSRAAVLSAVQRKYLEHVLGGLEDAVAGSIRLVLDLEEHVCPGQGQCPHYDVDKQCPCRR